MKFVTFTLVLMMSLMGCAQKKDAGQKKGIRPFNIAKKVEVDRVVPVILDERPLLATVTDLTAEPMQDHYFTRNRSGRYGTMVECRFGERSRAEG